MGSIAIQAKILTSYEGSTVVACLIYSMYSSTLYSPTINRRAGCSSVPQRERERVREIPLSCIIYFTSLYLRGVAVGGRGLGLTFSQETYAHLCEKRIDCVPGLCRQYDVDSASHSVDRGE